MINNLELFYILNGTEISLQNQKNELFLTLESTSSLSNVYQNPSNNQTNIKCTFKVSGIHPYLLNNDFDQEIRTISKFKIVLCSMPDFSSNKERSIIKYGDQVSFMLPNNLFIVATNDGDLKLQRLNGDQTLSSINLPLNSKFTIIPPENKFPANKPLFYDDIIILRSSFGGNLSLTTSNNSKIKYEKGGEMRIGNIDDVNTGINSNSNLKMDECKWKVVKVDIPLIPSWHKKRKYLNDNMNAYLYYLDKSFYKTKNINDLNSKDGLVNSREISTIIDKSKEKLSSLPSIEQDKILVDDLLLAMMGLEGKYIKRVVNNTSYKDFKVEFEVEPYLDNPTCDPPLLSLTNLILPMGYYYSSITYFLNMGSKPETGLIVKGFCEGLKKLLREYILFVNQLEELKKNSTINLQQLWWVCQPPIKILECLHKLCQKCFMVKGGALLNIIYSSYLHENDTQIKSIYKYLLNKSFMPFFDMIKMWVCHGFLENEHDFQEFMIFSPKSYIKEKLNDYYHDLFWETKFILSNMNVPTFLANIAPKILFIGKSYNIIKECGKNIKCPYELEFESFRDYDKDKDVDESIDDIIKNNFNIYRKNEIVDFNGNNNIYDNNSSNQMIFETERVIEFENLIDRIYQWINSTLKNVLFNEKDLILMIYSFKKYFLMEAGDFYNDFIEMNLDLFNKYGFSFEYKRKGVIDPSPCALLSEHFAEITDQFIEIHPDGLKYLTDNLSNLKTVSNPDALMFYNIYESYKNFKGNLNDPLDGPFRKVMEDGKPNYQLKSIITRNKPEYRNTYYMGITEEYKKEATNTIDIDIHNKDKFDEIIKNKKDIDISNSIFSNPYVVSINKYIDYDNALIYNFDGVRISRLKVLRIYNKLIKNGIEDSMDSFMYAITYKSILSELSYTKIYNCVKKEAEAR